MHIEKEKEVKLIKEAITTTAELLVTTMCTNEFEVQEEAIVFSLTVVAITHPYYGVKGSVSIPLDINYQGRDELVRELVKSLMVCDPTSRLSCTIIDEELRKPVRMETEIIHKCTKSVTIDQVKRLLSFYFSYQFNPYSSSIEIESVSEIILRDYLIIDGEIDNERLGAIELLDDVERCDFSIDSGLLDGAIHTNKGPIYVNYSNIEWSEE